LVAVRRKKERGYSSQQELLEIDGYDYFCYITTENYTAWETHKYYGQLTTTSETWIEEAKSQLGLVHINTNDFLANGALFQFAILADNRLRLIALTSNNAQLRKWETG